MAKPLATLISAIHYTSLWRVVFCISLTTISWLAITDSPPELAQASWDKLNHVFAFSALSIGAWLSAPRSGTLHRLIGVMTYGIIIEIVQAYLPHRSASGLDLLADLIGISVGEASRGIIQWLQAHHYSRSHPDD